MTQRLLSAAVRLPSAGFLSLLLLLGLVPAAWAQTGPQPELPKERLVIASKDGQRHEFNVELALTPDQQTVGEMFRTSVPPDGGMLFDWGREQDSNMWMRNTKVPLDMLFINADGTIRRIAEQTVPESLAIIPSGGPVRATLEVAGGTARRLGVHVGDRVLHRTFGSAP